MWCDDAVMDPFLPDDEKVAAIREVLPAVASGIRLDVTVAGPFPAETAQAVRQMEEHELRVGRGGPERPEELAQRLDEAASVVAAVLATSPGHVVVTPGPVAAVSAALVALRPSATRGVAIDGALGTRMDSVVTSVAQAHGLTLGRRTGDGDAERAGLIVAAHVDPVTGRVLEPRRVADRTHGSGGSLLLDMGWSVGAIPVDVASSGADVVVIEAHRWLLGPEGVTALWAADRAVADRARVLVDPPSPSQLLGLARSVGWLLMYVGLPWAFERARTLTARLRDALAAIDGVVIEPSSGGMATTLPFRVVGWSPSEVAVELARRVHAHLDVDEERGLLRAGIGAWHREDEVAQFATALAEVARHTPETLPRRPLLTVLSLAAQDEP